MTPSKAYELRELVMQLATEDIPFYLYNDLYYYLNDIVQGRDTTGPDYWLRKEVIRNA